MTLDVDPERLQTARVYAAQINIEMAKHAHDEDYGFADHITDEDKDAYVIKNMNYASEVMAGKHDDCFTIWQRMNYFLTGECVPFLPRH